MITSHNQNLLPRAVCAKLSQTSGTLGSISVALSCLVYPPREESSGRSAGSFPEQRLVIEPTGTFVLLLQWCSIHLSCFGNFPRYTMQFAISKRGLVVKFACLTSSCTRAVKLTTQRNLFVLLFLWQIMLP